MHTLLLVRLSLRQLARRHVCHPPLHHGAVVAAALILSACDDSLRPAEQQIRPISQVASFFECAVSFRVITYEEDSETAAKFQWPAQSDTVDVCETWTGGDYRYVIKTAGTSERLSPVSDLTRDAYYTNGTLYTTKQGAIVFYQPAGASLFETVNADAGQIQASYDDPYYGIASPDGCEIRYCGSLQANLVATRADPDTLFRRHGLSRRGVRALVNDLEEVGRSPEGYRRFRRLAEGREHTVLIDPETQLIVGETLSDDITQITARHSWSTASFGHARAGSVVEVRSRGPDARVVRRTTMVISDVQLAHQ